MPFGFKEQNWTNINIDKSDFLKLDSRASVPPKNSAKFCILDECNEFLIDCNENNLPSISHSKQTILPLMPDSMEIITSSSKVFNLNKPSASHHPRFHNNYKEKENEPLTINSLTSSIELQPRKKRRSSKKPQKIADRGHSTPMADSSVDSQDMCVPAVSCLDHLSTQIYEFHRRHEQSMNSLTEKLNLRDLLYYAIAPHFIGCGLYITGSTLNGFGTMTSDMDLCLMITPRDLDQRVDAILVLSSVMGHLKDLPWVKDMDLIFAKVPILRATFNPPFENIIVDLNANNSVAIRNTHLLCYYSAFDWRVRPLVCVIKEWAKRRGINDANKSSLTSYSLVLLVIHYLQCGMPIPVLPSLQQLFPERFGNQIDVRSLNVTESLAEVIEWDNDRNSMSLGELLIGFFKYYQEEFDFDTDAISVRLGRVVGRKYVVNNSTPTNYLSQWRCICIEEPFTYSNTAHSVFDDRVFNCIKKAFEEASDTLSKNSDLNSLIDTKPITFDDGIPTGFRHFRVPVIRYDRENHEATEKEIVRTIASFHMGPK